MEEPAVEAGVPAAEGSVQAAALETVAAPALDAVVMGRRRVEGIGWWRPGWMGGRGRVYGVRWVGLHLWILPTSYIYKPVTHPTDLRMLNSSEKLGAGRSELRTLLTNLFPIDMLNIKTFNYIHMVTKKCFILNLVHPSCLTLKCCNSYFWMLHEVTIDVLSSDF